MYYISADLFSRCRGWDKCKHLKDLIRRDASDIELKVVIVKRYQFNYLQTF